MGNSASSSRGHQDETVDYGFLIPQGVYTGTPDWNHQIVTQLIVERRLAPFYRPLEDYDENWDDEQILAARKPLPLSDVATSESGSRSEQANPPNTPSRPNHTSQVNRRPGALKEPSRNPEAMIYRGAAECPICFLYYPPNINKSRCCDQSICTECFVQIKRSEPTTTHVVSEPAACPYCVQENFGVTYIPPSWRAGIGSDGPFPNQVASRPTTQPSLGGRRKSFGADSPQVVTIDQIRPDWEAKLAAVRAAVARRANRRIIMRQVGDRLIPVGVTSGRIHPLAGADLAPGPIGEEGGADPIQEGRLGRRARRRQQQQAEQQQNRDLNQLLGTMGLGGQDLEELMIMEAMRLSLIDHEEQKRKEAEEKRKKEGQLSNVTAEQDESNAGPSSSSPGLPPIPVSTPINVAQLQGRSSEPHSSASSRPSLSLENRPSPLGSSFGKSVSPSPSGSAPQGSPTQGVSYSRSGSATPDLREAALRKRIDTSLPSLPGDSLESQAEQSLTTPVAPATANSTSSASDSDNAPLSSLVVSSSSPALQKETGPRPVPHTNMTSLSVATAASELTGGPSYDELPSSPNSPSHRPLLFETPVSEMPELDTLVGRE